ncbi:MAG: TrbG/VirB9 family P-type conjugative transfer protein [Caldilinea sp.]|nr:TrbG/VirB9 family P-type conjugative transfer protein [Caldilinea sp.]MDW8438900.1 TrbG/VirB9 family P-type conjugative transfer protein [Caldilineaceae bacterium]
MHNKLKVAAIVIALAASFPALAQKARVSKTDAPAIIEARPDALIKQFVYDPNTVFEVRTRAGMFTHIEVPKGEKIHGFYLSDTTFWKYVVAQDGARVLVRPSEAGRYNSGTMITDKRVYEFAFRSFATDEPHWYQRVQWAVEPDAFPGWGVFADPGDLLAAKGAHAQVAAQATTNDSKSEERPAEWTVDMQRARFDYRVSQTDSFAPMVVFDDGVFTYMRFPPLQDMPAIFAFDSAPSEARIVDYVVRGNNVLVHRVVQGGFILKLGNRTVVVERVAAAGR